VLSEPQIQRYARQVLLQDVGERGQEALGAVRVELAVGGEVARAAAAYLRAGGTEVNVAEGAPGPWAGTPPLLGPAPSRLVEVTAAPDVPGAEGIAVGQRPGAHVLWSVGGDGCPACLRTATRELRPPAAQSTSAVQVGTLLALLVQRRALGVSPPLEGVEISDTGVLSTVTVPVCAHRPPVVPPALLAELLRHLAAALPDEGCAVLVGSDSALRLVRMVNAQGAHHARDPAAFPRTARNAFSLDPRAWLDLLRSTEAAGERVLAIAHSHPDGGDRLSAEDRRLAAPDGEPLLPGVAHLVVAFRGGRPASARWSLWTDGDFVEWDCPLPEKS